MSGQSLLPPKQLVKIFSGHYDEFIINRDCKSISNKFSPWYFRPWQHTSNYSNTWNPKNNNLFFRGLYIPKVRDTIKVLDSKKIADIDVSIDPNKRQNFLTYHNNTCSSLINLSISGIRDMCNRDIELWRAGCPFIKPRFTSQLLVDIPDDVYFPVEWDQDYNYITPIPKDKDKLAHDIIDKFNSIKTNKNLIKKTSELGKIFYRDNFSMSKICQNSFNLLLKSGLLN